MKFANDAEPKGVVILSNPLIDQIKTKLPIMEALARYTDIAPIRKGNRYWCNCLFHNEKTPSMSINPESDRFYCFGCHAHGDQIDLVAEALNLPLSDAIQLLIKDLGLDGTISQEERDRIELEQARRQQERQRKIDQQNTIKQEYKRLIDIEKQMYSFLLTIDSGLDLNRHEVIKSLQHKELIGYWIDSLFNGSLDEQLAVVEVSKDFNPWKE
jgi:DNA primase